MDRERYQKVVRGFAGRHIVVLGDLMMDEYLWGRATRISPESPVMVVEVDRETRVPGGAANVVNNLLALGAQVTVLGVVGADEAGEALRESLKAAGANVGAIVTDPSRPTTRKTRVVAHSQQVVRIDREQTHAVSTEVARQIAHAVTRAAGEAQAILISDYSKGTLAAGVAETAVVSARNAGIIVTANPKPSSARSLAHAHVVSFNQSEAEILAGNGTFTDDKSIDAVGADLRKGLEVDALVVTRGSKGLSLWTENDRPSHFPAHPVEVYDVAGAGDTVISAMTLGLIAGAEIAEAVEIANHAAACVVRKLGVATVSPEELIADWWDTGAGA